MVKAYAKLGSKIPDAGISTCAIILRVKGWTAEPWILVIGPEGATSALSPEGVPVRANKVPAENGRGRNSGISTSCRVESAALLWSTRRVGACRPLEFRRIRLPKGKELDCVFEVSAERASSYISCEDLTEMDPCHEELEVIAVFRKTISSLNHRADFVVLPA